MEIFPPCVVALVDVPLNGKTTLGEKLATITNFTHFVVDFAREKCLRKFEKTFGRRPESHSPEGLRLMEDAYDMLVDEARKHCSQKPVVITGTFSKDEFKQPLLNFILRKL